jgi:hypothetical protein
MSPAPNTFAVIEPRETRRGRDPGRSATPRKIFRWALDEPNHRLLIIGCRKPTKMLVLKHTETGRLVASVDCCGDTDDLFHDPAAKRIYLTWRGRAASA